MVVVSSHYKVPGTADGYEDVNGELTFTKSGRISRSAETRPKRAGKLIKNSFMLRPVAKGLAKEPKQKRYLLYLIKVFHLGN